MSIQTGNHALLDAQNSQPHHHVTAPVYFMELKGFVTRPMAFGLVNRMTKRSMGKYNFISRRTVFISPPSRCSTLINASSAAYRLYENGFVHVIDFKNNPAAA